MVKNALGIGILLKFVFKYAFFDTHMNFDVEYFYRGCMMENNKGNRMNLFVDTFVSTE